MRYVPVVECQSDRDARDGSSGLGFRVSLALYSAEGPNPSGCRGGFFGRIDNGMYIWKDCIHRNVC